MRTAILVAALGLVVGASACSSTTMVRVQPDAIEVGRGLRPVAAIQANAASAYLLFVPLPGGVDLDRVVNRMLIAKAKIMGADKVANLQFEITPDDGIWKVRRFLGWRSARASGIAVQITDGPVDPDADDGPEPAAPAGPGPEGDPAGAR